MINNNIQTTIKAINDTFNTLSGLSCDDLRIKFNSIRSRVSEGEANIDDVLVDVFAIVKETMRRFTLGCIKVKATQKDITLAKCYDFVFSDTEGNALYQHRWNVLGEKFIWNMVPYDEQLQGGIEIHNGRILQMATGEGKTLVAVAPVVLDAMNGKGVHLMTVNEYLSKRDFEITRPIYSFLGFSVGCIEGKAIHSSRRKEAYNCDITFGTTSGFVFDYLHDNTAKKASQCVQNKFGVAIIDEADSVMIDEANTPHILSGDIHTYINNNENPYKKYMSLVKQMTEIDTLELYKTDTLRKNVSLTEQGKKWLANACGCATLFDNNLYTERIKLIDANNSLTENQKIGMIAAERNQRLAQLKMQDVLYRLLTAFTVYEKDVDYIVSGNSIVIVDPNTGRLKPSYRWEYGLHEAIMAKEHLSPDMEIENIIGSITVRNYLSLYKKISGMTGTAITTTNDWLDVYSLEVAVIPTHKPVIRKDNPLRVFATSKQALVAMLKEVIKLHKERRPILIGTNTIKQSEHITEFLNSKGLKPQLLNAKTLSQEAYIIAMAGNLDSITVATNVAGRGTDIKPADEALNVGGLAVIGLGIADSQRIDKQFMGRTGRQGNPGSSQFFVSCEDKIIGFLSGDDKNELERLASHADLESGEIIDNRIINLFLLAQRNKEEEDRNDRMETIKRDNIIAPIRLRLYGARMQLLRQTSKSTVIGNDLFGFWNDPVFISSYESHKKDFEEKAMPMVERALLNSASVDVCAPLPFIINGKIFNVICNFRNAVATQGSSIGDDFERQILLSTIDEIWFGFLNGINNPLIQKTEYETKYKKIFILAQERLKQTLLSATLPVNENIKNNNVTNDFYSNSLLCNSTCDKIGIEDPCPCGSGMPYWKCHGRLNSL